MLAPPGEFMSAGVTRWADTAKRIGSKKITRRNTDLNVMSTFANQCIINDPNGMNELHANLSMNVVFSEDFKTMVEPVYPYPALCVSCVIHGISCIPEKSPGIVLQV